MDSITIKFSLQIDPSPLIPGSAIDNATRGLIGLGQMPVTCGLFFSLGHSTIVVVVVSFANFLLNVTKDRQNLEHRHCNVRESPR
jgi:high-affinity nickel permease